MRASFTVIFVPVTFACGAGADFDEGGPEIDSQTHAVLNGTPVISGFPNNGVVDINLEGDACSGSLQGPRLILTAAHCLPGASGTGGLRATYREYGNKWCITAASATQGNCSSNTSVYYERLSSYTEAGDYQNDLGVIVMPDRDFSHVTYSDFARILVSQPSTSWDIILAGGGGVSGNTTFGTFDLNLSTSSYLRYASSTYGLCSGDSGGPAFFVDSSGYKYVSAQHSGGPAGCAADEGDSRGARWTSSRVAWVDDVLDDVAGGGCASYSNPYGTHYKCF